MTFLADLHIHSKYSRATSRDCDLEHLALWGKRKGITVIGTGDFTHPAWFREIFEKLIPAEPGLFCLRPELEKSIDESLPPTCRHPIRFLLSVEISTIYKKKDRVRKIHHLVMTPTLTGAEKIIKRLSDIGNLKSDGRPILGLDSRNLLEITLEQGGEGSMLIPAHIWTPWFAVFGSKSGFDSIEDCYSDLSEHIFALETGLSSDPLMNEQISKLDRYCLVSNSDAHSPQKLGREANIFDTSLDYFEMKKSLQTGEGFGGTLEFFPEEGKYHLDGHRQCEICYTPKQTQRQKGLCPKCKKPLTVGVLSRVEELSDRKENERPKDPAVFQSLIPLPEILSELLQKGPATQTVMSVYFKLLEKLGPELFILTKLPLSQIKAQSSELFAEAVRRMRAGEVIRNAGFDGVFGVIRLFQSSEIQNLGKNFSIIDDNLIKSSR